MRMPIVAIAAMASATSQGLAMDSLSQYEWKNRILLVFGAVDDPQASRQVEVLRQGVGEVAERDLVVLHVTGTEVVPIFGGASTIEAARLRTEADAPDGTFQVVLVGKDGGIKLRSSSLVDNAELFSLIDSMPMRRAGQR